LSLVSQFFFYISGDPDASSSKPFELLGGEGSSGGENTLFSTSFIL